MTKIRIRAFMLLSVAVLVGAPTSSSARDVIVRTAEEMKTSEGGTVGVIAYTFKASDVHLHIVAAVTLRTESDPRSSLSVRDLEASGRLVPAPGKWLLVSNGGFSGLRADRPIGLLIADGKILSLPDYSSVRGDPNNECLARQKDWYRFSGVLCAAKNGGIRIDELDEAVPESCQDALQAGPLLFDGARKNAICPTEITKAPYERTVVCTAGTMVSVLVTSGPVHLYDLASWLAAHHGANTKASAPGAFAACTQAINLSGATSSGSFLHPRSGPTVFDGPGRFPQASFLVVRPVR
jgi:hypothetical protein